MTDAAQYADEETCAQAWLAWYSNEGFVPLVPLGQTLGRADRYYTSGNVAIAVEITRVLNPVKQEMERLARQFVERDVAPLLIGRLSVGLFAEIHPPWRIPQSRRRALAEKVAAKIMSVAPHLEPGEPGDCSQPPEIRLWIRRSYRDRDPGLVFGLMSGLYDGWEGAILREQVGAVRSAIEAKAIRRQADGQDISWRVLILDDRMLGITPEALDLAIKEIPEAALEAFDEIALVSQYNGGSVNTRYLLPRNPWSLCPHNV
jgi:hypothetical protein